MSSAMVAPDGREIASSGFFEPAYLDDALRLKTDITPATRWGPMINAVLVVLGGASVVAAMLHNGSFARRRRRAGARPENDEGVS